MTMSLTNWSHLGLEQQDKAACAGHHVKRSRQQQLADRAALRAQWNMMAENHPDKQHFRSRFHLDVAAKKLRRITSVADAPPVNHVNSSENWRVCETSLWGLGCTNAPLASEFLDGHRGPGLGVRPLYDAAKHKSTLSQCLLLENRREVELKVHELQAKIRSQRSYSATCFEMFGPQLCRTRDAARMPAIFAVFKKLWAWVTHRWCKDMREGMLLAHFMSTKEDGETRHVYSLLSRRLGRPQKLIFTTLLEVIVDNVNTVKPRGLSQYRQCRWLTCSLLPSGCFLFHFLRTCVKGADDSKWRLGDPLSHITGHALAASLLLGARKLSVAEAEYVDVSLEELQIARTVEGTEVELFNIEGLESETVLQGRWRDEEQKRLETKALSLLDAITTSTPTSEPPMRSFARQASPRFASSHRVVARVARVDARDTHRGDAPMDVVAAYAQQHLEASDSDASTSSSSSDEEVAAEEERVTIQQTEVTEPLRWVSSDTLDSRESPLFLLTEISCALVWLCLYHQWHEEASKEGTVVARGHHELQAAAASSDEDH
eukprot:6456099-Amphidinium_carterae.2